MSRSQTTDNVLQIRIKSLYIHPIKSCRGSAVNEAYFDDGGLRFDRTWLIIDASTRRFQTARDLPKMVTISPHMDLAKNTLRIDIPLHDRGRGTVAVRTPLDPSQEELNSMEIIQDINIWGQKVDGYAVSSEADEALTTFFGKSVRLVRKGPTQRPAGPDDPRGKDSAMHYQDFYPILLASSASLQHVRDTLVASVYPNLAQKETQSTGGVSSYKVSEKVSRELWTPEHLESLPIERFRPNILVESFEGDAQTSKALRPWEEDGWTHIEIFSYTNTESHGSWQEIPFGASAQGKGTGIDCVIRCGRCMVPNIDPDDGVRDSFLPYTVLQRFRQVQPELKTSGKPCFGMLSCPSQPGE